MRKGFAILIMLLVCSVYVISIKQDPKGSNEKKGSVDLNKQISKLEILNAEIQQNYPSTPKAVIEANNRIMSYHFSKDMTPEEVGIAVDTLRLLYSKELLELNDRQQQIDQLTLEILNTQLEEAYLEESTIDTIEFVDDYLTIVEVSYHLSSGKNLRTYYVIRENGQWKIHSWEDSVSMSQDTDTEE